MSCTLYDLSLLSLYDPLLFVVRSCVVVGVGRVIETVIPDAGLPVAHVGGKIVAAFTAERIVEPEALP